MILHENIIQLRRDPRIIATGNEKTPKYVVPERATAPMTDKGIYLVLEREDKRT